MCASHCAQLLHTILHRTDLIVFSLTLQTSLTLHRYCKFRHFASIHHHSPSSKFTPPYIHVTRLISDRCKPIRLSHSPFHWRSLTSMQCATMHTTTVNLHLDKNITQIRTVHSNRTYYQTYTCTHNLLSSPSNLHKMNQPFPLVLVIPSKFLSDGVPTLLPTPKVPKLSRTPKVFFRTTL